MGTIEEKVSVSGTNNGIDHKDNKQQSKKRLEAQKTLLETLSQERSDDFHLEAYDDFKEVIDNNPESQAFWNLLLDEYYKFHPNNPNNNATRQDVYNEQMSNKAEQGVSITTELRGAIQQEKRRWLNEDTLNIDSLIDSIELIALNLHYCYIQTYLEKQGQPFSTPELDACRNHEASACSDNTETWIEPEYVEECFRILNDRLSENSKRPVQRVKRMFNAFKGHENVMVPLEKIAKEWKTTHAEKDAASSTSWINKMFQKYNIGLEIENVSGYRLRMPPPQ